MPLLPPVTIARFPFNPKSMASSLFVARPSREPLDPHAEARVVRRIETADERR
jgi:hypothetical protein